jgi:hypothetical protein
MKYKCPVCSAEMSVVNGSSMNAHDGVTVYCPNKLCTAQEVSGHGKDEKSAWEIVILKYVKRDNR